MANAWGWSSRSVVFRSFGEFHKSSGAGIGGTVVRRSKSRDREPRARGQEIGWNCGDLERTSLSGSVVNPLSSMPVRIRAELPGSLAACSTLPDSGCARWQTRLLCEGIGLGGVSRGGPRNSHPSLSFRRAGFLAKPTRFGPLKCGPHPDFHEHKPNQEWIAAHCECDDSLTGWFSTSRSSVFVPAHGRFLSPTPAHR